MDGELGLANSSDNRCVSCLVTLFPLLPLNHLLRGTSEARLVVDLGPAATGTVGAVRTLAHG
jgi:hypothetical protein